jgi:hypothetical protein
VGKKEFVGALRNGRTLAALLGRLSIVRSTVWCRKRDTKTQSKACFRLKFLHDESVIHRFVSREVA